MNLKTQDIDCKCITFPCNCGKKYDRLEEANRKVEEETIKFLKVKKQKEKNKKIILYVAIAVVGYFAYKKFKK